VELVGVGMLSLFLTRKDLVDAVGSVLSRVQLPLLLLLSLLLAWNGCCYCRLGRIFLSLILCLLRGLDSLLVLAVVKVQGSGFRVQGSGFRVQGSGFRVQGSGFKVEG